MVTNKSNCPSIELNLIWNEKIFMIQRSIAINPFSSDFLCGPMRDYPFIEILHPRLPLFQTPIN